jgi:hypothetical protein
LPFFVAPGMKRRPPQSPTPNSACRSQYFASSAFRFLQPRASSLTEQDHIAAQHHCEQGHNLVHRSRKTQSLWGTARRVQHVMVFMESPCVGNPSSGCMRTCPCSQRTEPSVSVGAQNSGKSPLLLEGSLDSSHTWPSQFVASLAGLYLSIQCQQPSILHASTSVVPLAARLAAYDSPETWESPPK